MPAYRLYHIDGTGRFHGSEEVQADSDEHAMELSTQLLAGSSGELWISERMVCKLPRCREQGLAKKR